MNRKERDVKSLIFSLLLGLFVMGLFGCVRPEPDRPPETIETTEKTIKPDYKPVLPGD
jgi:hypothetical protein